MRKTNNELTIDKEGFKFVSTKIEVKEPLLIAQFIRD